MFNLGTTELIVLAVIGLVLFGHKLPNLARMLGSTLAELKRETAKLTEDVAGDRSFPPR